MVKKRITMWVIESTKPILGRVLKIAALEPRGFLLLVYPSGKKAFGMRYIHEGQRKMLVLGPFSGIKTLTAAEDKARILYGEVVKGKDPAADRKAQRAIPSFAAWADEYLAAVKERKRSYRQDKAYLKIAKEAWGSRPVNKITVEDVQKVFSSMKARGKTTANRWLASVRACLSEAWRLEKVPGNPAMRVKPMPENEARQRVLSMDELERLLDAVARLTDPHERIAFALLVDTGARLSEVLRARWEDFDLETGRWSLKTTKARRPTTKTLPSGTLAALKNTPRLGPYVVAGRPKGLKRKGTQEPPDKPRYDLKTAWTEVCKEAKLKEVHIHDIRRTFGLEVFRRFGVGAAAKALGHSSPQVTDRVYSPLQVEDERRITEAVAKDRAKVIRISKRGKATNG